MLTLLPLPCALLLERCTSRSPPDAGRLASHSLGATTQHICWQPKREHKSQPSWEAGWTGFASSRYQISGYKLVLGTSLSVEPVCNAGSRQACRSVSAIACKRPKDKVYGTQQGRRHKQRLTLKHVPFQQQTTTALTTRVEASVRVPGLTLARCFRLAKVRAFRAAFKSEDGCLWKYPQRLRGTSPEGLVSKM